jgi:hypothetical protein
MYTSKKRGKDDGVHSVIYFEAVRQFQAIPAWFEGARSASFRLYPRGLKVRGPPVSGYTRVV